MLGQVIVLFYFFGSLDSDQLCLNCDRFLLQVMGLLLIFEQEVEYLEDGFFYLCKMDQGCVSEIDIS